MDVLTDAYATYWHSRHPAKLLRWWGFGIRWDGIQKWDLSRAERKRRVQDAGAVFFISCRVWLAASGQHAHSRGWSERGRQTAGQSGGDAGGQVEETDGVTGSDRRWLRAKKGSWREKKRWRDSPQAAAAAAPCAQASCTICVVTVKATHNCRITPGRHRDEDVTRQDVNFRDHNLEHQGNKETYGGKYKVMHLKLWKHISRVFLSLIAEAWVTLSVKRGCTMQQFSSHLQIKIIKLSRQKHEHDNEAWKLLCVALIAIYRPIARRERDKERELRITELQICFTIL